ncbi:MAG: AAA family ATPase [Clostridia bacterium]|nr:AAA family ATPase [Clostridia bacterium]
MNAKKEQRRIIPNFLFDALPDTIILEIEEARRLCGGADIEEIRLRRERCSEFVFFGTSIMGKKILSAKEMDEVFYRLCGGSVYAYADTICQGYIRAENGVRIGICGRAVIGGGRVNAVHDISSINIRIPCAFLPDVKNVADIFMASYGGMLVFSPPGVGKTTLLRSLSKELSGRCKRKTALIDTRSELSAGLDGKDLRLDILEGYPRGIGIEIAVRTLNPDVIICDEIGSSSEADALLLAQSCGVPIIASAHGESAKSLIEREGISRLHRAGIFHNYMKIERERNSRNFKFTVTERDKISDTEGNDDV